jgi:hypothetical protein
MILDNISWVFSEKTYNDFEKFNQEVRQYQKDIYDDESLWIPNEVIFNTSELHIQYMAWISSSKDLLENEFLMEYDQDIFENNSEQEEYQVEIFAKLKADNGKNFTALEFLIKTHNQQSNKNLGDHIFFEGVDDESDTIKGLPTYYISCGS